ncbi:uncharacterized protein LOC106151092 [Lingula anatina]|uniref:Uncharacterized protein LOC106151092 n=1 Tax=Lingula anatina TaxID=7574 RepID=A0A1S3H0I5_LINAN|nr:uncharacterized protein LOC106151092 [Lingula anatina]|eukprot:XP_013379635.1 uncharacterized protein LOC106151092 [Lingula anatina]
MASNSGESETDQPSTAAASEPVEIEKKRNEFFQFILRGDHSGLRAMFPDPSPQNDQTHADENAPQPTCVRSGKPKTCRNLPFLGSSSRVHPESQGDKVNKGTAENLLFQSYPSTKDNCMKGTLLEGGLPLIVAACNVALPEETQKEIIDILMEKANNIFTPEKIEDLFSPKKNKKGKMCFTNWSVCLPSPGWNCFSLRKTWRTHFSFLGHH